MQIERVEIGKLTLDPANVRKHGDRNIETIVASLHRFGQQKPIVIDSNYCVRAGNGTVEAARQLGWSEIGCVVTDLSGPDATAYAIADNRTAELAEWDDSTLVATLMDLGDISDDLLESTGFSAADLERMMAECQGEVDETDVPSVPEEAVTQPGDIWALGDHRVACGDGRDMQMLDRLLQGELCDMCFTDPPYNVAYAGRTKDALTIKNDDMSGDEFLQFLRDAFSTVSAAIKPGSLVYVCHADSEGMRFRQAFEEAGLLLKQCLIWVKNVMVLGRQDYQWRHEPILYGWKPGEAHRFYANRKQTTVIDEMEGVAIEERDGKHAITVSFGGKTIVIEADSAEVVHQSDGALDSVWRVDKPSRNGEHPTMKPIRLCARAIEHGTRRGEVVLDLFLGSGSTLIAADQLGRRCYGFELDPKYCDVIVNRWENLTGKKAVLDGNTGHANDGESTTATVADKARVSGSDSKATGSGRRKPKQQPA